MRQLALVVAIGCSGAPAKPAVPPPASPPDAATVAHDPADQRIVAKQRYRIAVLAIEALGAASAQHVGDARKLTEYLRDMARDDPGADFNARRVDLVDEKLMTNCANEATSCMAFVGRNLDVDVLVYGHLDPAGAGYAADLRGLHVESQIVHTWSGTTTSADADLRATARTGYAAVVGRVE